MNEISFRYRKCEVDVFRFVTDNSVHALKNANIGSVGRRRNSKTKVINVR